MRSSPHHKFQSSGITSSQGPPHRALYIHIPYCASLCHYCDFAKTALFDDETTQRYFRALITHLKYWTEVLAEEGSQLTSLYLGGGTPGLFAHEYEPLFELLTPHFLRDIEITLESNPSGLSDENLRVWQDLGINRLSLGIQSLHQKHLDLLKRDHSTAEALESLQRAQEHFSHVCCDLIYAIPHQTLDEWQKDLERVVERKPQHLSLYMLSFEPRTPLGRAYHRGALSPSSMGVGEEFYHLARKLLASAGYHHEEVSNFALPGSQAQHNSRYWRMASYIGVGAGAHGYEKTLTQEADLRYFFRPQDRQFKELTEPVGSFQKYLTCSGAVVDVRSDACRLLETIATSVRTARGVPIEKIQQDFGLIWQPTPQLRELLSQGMVQLTGGVLYYHPKLWFFEHKHILDLEQSFIKN